MAKRNKKELIKQILNQGNIDAEENYDDLLDLLIDEPITINVSKDEKRTFGEKVSDKMTKIAGSWTFIFCFVSFLILWMLLNVFVFKDLDPYPFILLNLILSCIAAIQSPIILMSQNREAKMENLRNINDYKTNLKSELILEELHSKMDKIIKNQNEIINYIKANEENIEEKK